MTIEESDTKNLKHFTKPKEETEKNQNNEEKEYKIEIVWVNTIFILYVHLMALYTLFLLITGHVMLITFVFQMIVGFSSCYGITMGAHRLWAHNSYKAKLPLKIILAFFMCLIFVNDIFTFARDHRVHHKFCETNADPHNAKRGFFFSHCGWLMCRKHPDVINIGGKVCVDDLLADKVVMFHKKYYILLMVPCTFIFPTLIPYYLWNEKLLISFYMTLFRYVISINMVWCLNSVSHMFGTRPYDKNQLATELGFMKVATLGEGFHNYHHTFPWDYKTGEYGNDWRNSTKYFINICAWLGLAYDMKTASRDMILK